MPAFSVTVTAIFEAVPMYAVAVSSAGEGASGSGSYIAGATVSITAGTAPEGQRFKNWATESAGVNFADANSAATSFTMPENAVAVTAVFQANTYKVIVLAGTGAMGEGDYSPGEVVEIAAGTHPDGLPFRKWTVASGGNVILADANSAATAFIMPSVGVTLTAVFMATFTDSRDGKVYGKVKIGNQTWMAENLNLVDCY